jgi:hypothetical protein
MFYVSLCFYAPIAFWFVVVFVPCPTEYRRRKEMHANRRKRSIVNKRRYNLYHGHDEFEDLPRAGPFNCLEFMREVFQVDRPVLYTPAGGAAAGSRPSGSFQGNNKQSFQGGVPSATTAKLAKPVGLLDGGAAPVALPTLGKAPHSLAINREPSGVLQISDDGAPSGMPGPAGGSGAPTTQKKAKKSKSKGGEKTALPPIVGEKQHSTKFGGAS